MKGLGFLSVLTGVCSMMTSGYGIQKSLTLIHPGRTPPNPGFQWISMHDGSCSETPCNALYSVTQAVAQFTQIQYSVTPSGRQEKDSWMQSVQWVDIPLDALGLFQNLGQSFQNGLGNTPLDYTAQLKTTVIIVLRRLSWFFFCGCRRPKITADIKTVHPYYFISQRPLKGRSLLITSLQPWET